MSPAAFVASAASFHLRVVDTLKYLVLLRSSVSRHGVNVSELLYVAFSPAPTVSGFPCPALLIIIWASASLRLFMTFFTSILLYLDN